MWGLFLLPDWFLFASRLWLFHTAANQPLFLFSLQDNPSFCLSWKISIITENKTKWCFNIILCLIPNGYKAPESLRHGISHWFSEHTAEQKCWFVSSFPLTLMLLPAYPRWLPRDRELSRAPRFIPTQRFAPCVCVPTLKGYFSPLAFDSLPVWRRSPWWQYGWAAAEEEERKKGWESIRRTNERVKESGRSCQGEGKWRKNWRRWKS